jgi:hypothetical protein
MPPRWLCLLIVLFWLACNGWLMYSDLLPQVLPGQPPPFTIDESAEVQTRPPVTTWTVLRDDLKALTARTQVRHRARDLFELTAEYQPEKTAGGVSVNGLFLQTMTSTYRVNSDGDLLGLHVRLRGIPELARPLLDARFTATLDGEVKAGRLHTVRRFEVEGGREHRLPLADLAAPRGGTVLMPLHPVNRLRGLSPGQSWRMTILDPLAMLSAWQGMDVEARFVRAAVRPEVEEYTHGRYQDVPCLVIDYQGDNVQASTWARRHDGLVLCQQATIGKTRWEMVRE